MPTLFTIDGNRYFFYSNEGTEPPHVHVENGERAAKVWLNEIAVAHNYGFNSTEISKIMAVVATRNDEILAAWNRHFGQ